MLRVTTGEKYRDSPHDFLRFPPGKSWLANARVRLIRESRECHERARYFKGRHRGRVAVNPRRETSKMCARNEQRTCSPRFRGDREGLKDGYSCSKRWVQHACTYEGGRNAEGRGATASELGWQTRELSVIRESNFALRPRTTSSTPCNDPFLRAGFGSYCTLQGGHECSPTNGSVKFDRSPS